MYIDSVKDLLHLERFHFQYLISSLAFNQPIDGHTGNGLLIKSSDLNIFIFYFVLLCANLFDNEDCGLICKH